MRKGLVLKVAPVGIPYILNELTREECELVSAFFQKSSPSVPELEKKQLLTAVWKSIKMREERPI